MILELRRVAVARALVHAGSPSAVAAGRAMSTGYLTLTRGLRSHVGPRWTIAAAFPGALRMFGTGEVLPWPVCGLCGLPGVEPLDSWLRAHRLGGLP